MVRKLLLAALLFVTASADDVLYGKIQSLIGENSFREHRGLIEIVFSPAESYYDRKGLDTVRIIETLLENRLLDLEYGRPTRMELTFATRGTPLFFTKLMGETLRSMGYYRYVTEESRLQEGAFVWKISLTGEHAADPSKLRNELAKRGCRIVDIERESGEQWHYEIDMSRGRLNLAPLQNGREVTFRRSLDAHWLDVSQVERVTFSSLGANSWYPYITFYDRTMRLLKVYKRDRKTWQITLRPPRDAAYAKVADLYSLKNIKDGFRILPRGAK
jgi:hypothetical protein